jgi:hypothetical protein
LAGEGGDIEGSVDDDDDIEGDGVSLAGAGLGKGTRRKMIATVVRTYALAKSRACWDWSYYFGVWVPRSEGDRVVRPRSSRGGG